MILFAATICTLVTGRMRDDCVNDVRDNKKESQRACLREQLYLCRIFTLFKWAFLPASKLKMLLSNTAFETFLNGYFFKLLFMYSLRKASQINNRYCLGSIYKQAPSRNLNCSLFVCLCFTAPGRHQTISLVLPWAEETEQRNPWAHTVQEICKYFGASEFSKPVTFVLKLRRARMNTKLDAGRLGENSNEWTDNLLRGSEMGERETSTARRIWEREKQNRRFTGIYIFTVVRFLFLR